MYSRTKITTFISRHFFHIIAFINNQILIVQVIVLCFLSGLSEILSDIK